jgi:hypothetical protein
MRAWIDGVMAQIEDPRLSELSAVILWNVGQVARDKSEIEPVGYARILELLGSIARRVFPIRTALPSSCKRW